MHKTDIGTSNVTIHPKSLIFLIPCALSLPVSFVIVSFMILIEEDSIVFFAIGMVSALVMGYFFVKAMLFQVSFINDRIISTKTYYQNEPLDVGCDQLLTCEFCFEGILQYVLFDCKDGEERMLYITPFSEKQFLRIAELIKERGGLREQSIEEIAESIPKIRLRSFLRTDLQNERK